MRSVMSSLSDSNMPGDSDDRVPESIYSLLSSLAGLKNPGSKAVNAVFWILRVCKLEIPSRSPVDRDVGTASGLFIVSSGMFISCHSVTAWQLTGVSPGSAFSMASRMMCVRSHTGVMGGASASTNRNPE